MTLDEARVAADLEAVVIYSPEGGFPETGVVTGTNETVALVRYGADTESKATSPADLAFAFVNDAMMARKRAQAAGPAEASDERRRRRMEQAEQEAQIMAGRMGADWALGMYE